MMSMFMASYDQVTICYDEIKRDFYMTMFYDMIKYVMYDMVRYDMYDMV